jgi:2-hydroxychromene-2-carboxylate isomerase
MGDLVYLDARRTPRPRASELVRPTFFFDLACPFSYLVAERIERTLGDAEFVPVTGASLAARVGSGHELAALRRQAEVRARQLRLPIVWPDRFPAGVPCALRAATFASEIGTGPRFALAASRLAFCGGFDLDDPETLAEAAAAAGLPLDACLEAAGDPGLDEAPLLAAGELRARGVVTVPAIDVGGRLFGGEAGLLAAAPGACGPSPPDRARLATPPAARLLPWPIPSTGSDPSRRARR